MLRFPQSAWIALGLCATAFGQRGPQAATIPPGNVSGFINLVRTVMDLDKSVAFYHEVYGLEIKSQDKAPVKDKAFQKLSGMPGVKVRRALLAIPQATFGLELVEYTGVKRTPIVLRLQDTGNTNLDFQPRDIDAVWAAAKKLGATAMTATGDVMDQKNASNVTTVRFLFLHDPDGGMEELTGRIPAPAASAPGGSKVLTASFSEISSHDQKLIDFYKGLGVELRAGNAAEWTPFREALTGTGHTSLRSNPVLIPQSPDRWSILEYAESDGKAFHSNLQDPGVSMFALRVHDAATAAQAAKAGGGSIVSAGGQPVKTAKGTSVIVRAPDGFFLELVQE